MFFCQQVMKFCPWENHWLQYIVSKHLSQGFIYLFIYWVQFSDIGGVPIIQLSQFWLQLDPSLATSQREK
jgi:hypothetical protein